MSFVSHSGVLALSPSPSSLPILLPCHVPGGATGNGLSTWNPAAHVGDLDGAPTSWLQPGPAAAVASI